MELDLYWAVHSYPGKPIDLIKRQPGRFVMWHIKDMDKITRDYTELGNGSIDWNEEISPTPNDIGFDYSYIMAATNDRTPTVYVENRSVVGLEADDPLYVSYKENR